MHLEDSMLYAGELLAEIEEVKQIMADRDELALEATSTLFCGTFLTIGCC